MAFKFVEQNNKESMIIYKLTNKINGKIYIGQTTWPFNSRWSAHCAPSAISALIDRAIKKHGKENFLIEIENWNTLDELNSREVQLIKELNSTDKKIGYNITLGGKNALFSQESKNKMSTTKRRMFENGTLNPWNKGLSSETNSMIKITAEKKKGQKRSQQSKDNMSKGHLGKTYEQLHGNNAEKICIRKGRTLLAKQGLIIERKNPNSEKVDYYLSYKEAYASIGMSPEKNNNPIKTSVKRKSLYKDFFWNLLINNNL